MALIDREDLLNTLDSYELTKWYHGDLITIIFDAPTVDAEPVRHGEWELKHVGAGHYWKCSVCHTNPCIYVTKDTNFCPNCGARMDGK